MEGQARYSATRTNYRCTARSRHQAHLPPEDRCPGTYFKTSVLDDLVWTYIVKQVSDEALIEDILATRGDLAQEERIKSDRELGLLIGMEAALKREADKLLDLHIADMIDQETLGERMSATKKKQAAIATTKAEIIARASQREEALGALSEIKALCAQVRRGIPFLMFDDKREILQALNIRVEVKKEGVDVSGLITRAVLGITDRYADTEDVNAEQTKETDPTVVLCPTYQHRRDGSQRGRLASPE